MVPKPTPIVKAVLLADQVFRQEGNGKWCIIGEFDKILAPRFPARHPSLAVFLKITSAEGEYGVHIEIHDSSDRCVTRIGGLALDAKDRLATFGVGLQASNLVLPKAGAYRVRVFFDGVQSTTQDTPFEARLLEEATR